MAINLPLRLFCCHQDYRVTWTSIYQRPWQFLGLKLSCTRGRATIIAYLREVNLVVFEKLKE
jgi:hypothetical protein